MRIIAALLGLFLLAGMPASAQAPEPPAQVRELLKLLGEPAVRSWLDAELKKAPPKAQGAESSFSRFAAERLALTRARLNRLGAAVSQLPEELQDAGAVLGGELQNRSPLGILVLVLGFGLLGAGAEWAFRRATHAARLRAEHAPFDTVAHRLRATAVRFGFGLAAGPQGDRARLPHRGARLARGAPGVAAPARAAPWRGRRRALPPRADAGADSLVLASAHRRLRRLVCVRLGELRRARRARLLRRCAEPRGLHARPRAPPDRDRGALAPAAARGRFDEPKRASPARGARLAPDRLPRPDLADVAAR